MKKNTGIWFLAAIFIFSFSSLIFSQENKDNPQAVTQETGSISGVIVLPEVKARGNLYIAFEQDPADGSAFIPGLQIEGQVSKNYYAMIKAEEITQNIVPYRIDGMTAGAYWGFVTWDISAPFCIAGGHVGCGALAGDYGGGSKVQAVLREGQAITDFDMDCKNLFVPLKKQGE